MPNHSHQSLNGSSNNRKRKLTKLFFDVEVVQDPNSTTLKEDILSPTPEELQHDLLGTAPCIIRRRNAALADEKRDTGSRVLEVYDPNQKETTIQPNTSSTASIDWWEQWEHLKEFHEQHGHCNVPASQQPLYDWTQIQRNNFKQPESLLSFRQRAALACLGLHLKDWIEEYNKFVQGKASQDEFDHWIQQQRNPIHPLNEQQRNLLKIVPGWDNSNPLLSLPQQKKTPVPDSDPDNKSTNKKTKQDAIWERQFAKLKKFQQKHGHCHLPKDFPDPQLKVWVNTQRTNYRLKRIPQPRIDKLESIRFPWSLERISWNDHYEQLKQYKEETGGCHVPTSYEDTQLVQWVSQQRNRFKTGTLSSERVKLLESIGFGHTGAGGASTPTTSSTTTSKEKKTLEERLAANNRKLQAQQAHLRSHQQELDKQQKQLQENGETIEFLLQHLSKRLEGK